MADFLTRLAERTLRTVPVAQPIIASMFAPGQFMTAPVQEPGVGAGVEMSEVGGLVPARSAETAPVQDPASAQGAETGSVTTTEDRAENMVAARAATTNLVEANSVLDDRAGTNRPGMNQTRDRAATSTSPILLANGAEGAMRQDDPSPNETPSEVYVLEDTGGEMLLHGEQSNATSVGATFMAPLGGDGELVPEFATSILEGDIQERAEVLIRTPAELPLKAMGAINRPLLTVEENVDPNVGTTVVAGRPGLPVLQTGFPTFAEEAGEQDSVGARLIAPSVPVPQPMVTNQLPIATGQPPLPGSPASGMTSWQGEPGALEQEEAISPQPVMEHNSIVPLLQEGRVRMSFEQKASLTSPQHEEASTHNVFTPLDTMIGTWPDSVKSAGAEQRDPRRVGTRLPTPRDSSPAPTNVIRQPADMPSTVHTTTEERNSTLVHLSLVGAREELSGAGGLVPALHDQGDRKGSPRLYDEATRGGYIVGAEFAPALQEQVHSVPQTTSGKGSPYRRQVKGEGAEHAAPTGHTVSQTASIKGPPGRSQSPSPQHTIGQVDVNSTPMGQEKTLPLETALQQQTDAPLINIFTPGSVRNQAQSGSLLTQHNPATLQQGSVTSSPADAAPTPSAIHITIGRIDVRAVTSPASAPPSKPARPGPLLSLDDYLKQGKGGAQ